MAYQVISQNNTTTTLADENGNIIRVPARVSLATSTDYTIKKVNNTTATLEDGNGNIIRDVPCVAVLYGGGGGGGDQHNLGWYETQSALETAHPTATDGDWAIVGSTDTVWVWDSDTNAWKDTDQKGQVASVNGQTGTVVLTASDVGAATTAQGGKADTAVQPGDLATVATTGAYSDLSGTPTIPTVGDGTITITQGGVTKGTFTTNQSGNTTIDVDAGGGSGLPDQTGNAGKFLTTDGTDASWSDKPLVNTATGTNSLTILGTANTTYTNSVNIGVGSSVTWAESVAIGYGAKAKQGTAIGRDAVSTGNGGIKIGIGSMSGGDAVGIGPSAVANANFSVAVGRDTRTTAENAVAIGMQAEATAKNAIQIGRGTNSTTRTFAVGLGYWDNVTHTYRLLDSDGTIPTARLTKVNSTITLAAADWSSNTQTVNVTGVTATGIVFVSPDPSDQSAYTSAGILCTAQAAGTLEFTCDTVPSADIDVNVVCL